jgi:thiol:disulfide interchange protein DsbD
MLLKILKRIFLISTLLIIGLAIFIYWPKPDLVYFELPKYSDHFHPRIEPTYFDYDQALRVAKKNNRLLLVQFTGHAVVGDRTAEFWPVMYQESRKFIENKLIFCELYVDDKAVNLDSSEWFLNSKGKLIKNLGYKNIDLQASKFDSNAQPFYAMVNPQDNSTLETFSYAKRYKNTWKLLKAYYSH